MTDFFVHFSNNPIEKVCHREQDPDRWTCGKPTGLWISDESENSDGWSSWCTSENYCNVQEQIAYEVRLNPRANILRLGCVEEIRDFANKYRLQEGRSYYMDSIDWKSVVENYDGIIITPYQWSIRLAQDFYWYYTWDCASGCIWVPEAIDELIQIDSNQFGRKLVESHAG